MRTMAVSILQRCTNPFNLKAPRIKPRLFSSDLEPKSLLRKQTKKTQRKYLRKYLNADRRFHHLQED
ncbi:hypothetical protein L2E82_27708 [Cichorium intybus]|uniref:Uncharacterized protein n=1 Tax=Cichorium intybus TaxID=13427 RepID=A0ACB9CU30_CICIN|nr:hypothetical protein L2E82_27708 [Cichorium intybus]